MICPRQLLVVFGAEDLTPWGNGGLRMRFDLLLHNSSAEAVDSLDVLCPHGVSRSALDGVFSDNSMQLCAHVPEQWPYLEPAQYDAGTNRLRLLVPHHTRPEEPQELVGTVRAPNEVIPWVHCAHPTFALEDHEVLAAQDYSGWRRNLRRPIAPDERRWFRWSIECPPSPAQQMTRLQWWDRRLVCGFTEFAQAIFGPYNVMDRLLSRIAVYEATTGTRHDAAIVEHGVGSSPARQLEQALERVRYTRSLIHEQTLPYRWDRLSRPGSDATPGEWDLRLRDYRIRLRRQSATALDVEAAKGDVIEAPGGPDDDAYEWKTGEDVSDSIPSAKHCGRFHVRYRARYDHFWWRFGERVLCLGLAVAAFVIGLLALYR